MFLAQYGNPNSYYGNIELGVWQQTIQPYGAWPEDIQANSPMLNWEEPIAPIMPPIAIDHIALIKRLRDELKNTEDTAKRVELRHRLDSAKQAKIRAFQLAARIDEEEIFFILH